MLQGSCFGARCYTPEPEIVVPGYTRSVIDKSGTGLIEADEKFMHAKGLLVAKGFGLLKNWNYAYKDS